MTATETHTAAPVVVSAPADEAPGLYRVVTTSDHKTIGRLYLAFSLLFALVVLAMGILVGFERANLDAIDIFSGAAAYAQAATLFKLGLIVLVVVPLFIGLATLVVPLQIGSPSIAFPRAAAAAFWTWLAGGLIFAISIAADGGLSASGDADAVELTILGLILTLVALLLASVCLATTVVSLRPAGMSLRRAPFFSWSILVAASVWILTLPVAVANLVIGYVDFHRGNLQFGSALGPDTAWLLRPPQVFAFAIPALGILFDVVPTVAKVRQNLYGVVLAGIGLFGLCSFGAFAQNTTANIQEQFVYLALAFAALAPVLVLLGGLGDTFTRGRANIGLPPAALLFALLGSLVVFAGVAMAAIRAVVGFDLIQAPGTTAADAAYAAALFGGLCAALGGIAWWAPKITGRVLPEVARPLALLVAGGALIAAVPELISGFLDQPSGLVVDSVRDGVEVLNLIAAVGVSLVALGLLGMIGLLLKSARGAALAGADPHDGQTLEWLSASPPAVGNFAEAVATVRSAQPLLDRKEKGDR